MSAVVHLINATERGASRLVPRTNKKPRSSPRCTCHARLSKATYRCKRARSTRKRIEKEIKRATMSSKKASAGFSYKIIVTLIEARGLRTVDHTFRSSTGVFARLKLKDLQGKEKQKQKTAICSSSSTNPKWNEAIELQPCEPTDDLQVTLENKVSLGNTFLGRLAWKVSDVLLMDRSERWHALGNRKSSDSVTGELLLRINFEQLSGVVSAYSKSTEPIGAESSSSSTRPRRGSAEQSGTAQITALSSMPSDHSATGALALEVSPRQRAALHLSLPRPNGAVSPPPRPGDSIPRSTTFDATNDDLKVSAKSSTRAAVTEVFPRSSSPSTELRRRATLSATATTAAAPVSGSSAIAGLKPRPDTARDGSKAVGAAASGSVIPPANASGTATPNSAPLTAAPSSSSVSAAASATTVSAGPAAPKAKGVELFRKTFKLPDTESLLAELTCSLVKTIPLHGRLYVSKNYFCFYSSLLAIKTCETIPLADVIDIQSASKDSVLVVTRTANFQFSSFRQSRDEAFALLVKAWRHELSEAPSGAGASDASGVSGEGAETDEGLDAYLSAATYEQGFLSGGVTMTELVREEFDVTVLRFFKLFFADDSTFSQAYHDKREDKDLVVEPWTAHPQWGLIRSLKYRAPVRATFGPKETNMTEAQRYNLQKDRLIVETTTVLHDIPYGDYFTIEGRWDISQSQPNRSLLVVSIGLNFSKKTILKGKIESSTIKESKDSYDKWVSLAKEVLAARQATRKGSMPTTTITPVTSVSAKAVPAESRFSALWHRAHAFAVRVQIPFTLLLLAIMFLWAMLLSYRISVLRGEIERLQAQAQNVTASSAATCTPQTTL